MNRADALKVAWETVSQLEKTPVKANGYPADGWRNPTFEERVTAVLRIADFLTEGDE